MQKTILTVFAMLGLAIGITSCNQPAKEAEVVPTEATNVAAAPTEDELKKFLYDPEGYYGWETEADKISFDFLEDGRLHIQGPDGESTMWEGTWSLKGDQITLDRKDLGKTEIYTVRKDGEKLFLGEKEYTRYKPM